MAYKEKDIRPYVKLIVEEEGKITTTELNERLREILPLTDSDKEILEGRNDDRFSQIVRNLVRYQGDENNLVDRHGYIVDKSTRPATFYAKNYSGEVTVKVPEKEIEKRKKKRRKYVARKVDFEARYEENRVLGDAGERYIYDYEINRLKELGVTFDVFDEVIHTSKVFGDGAGYDILSKEDEEGKNLYIEVKTTKGGLNTPFFISINELRFMEDYKEEARIYRVYNFDYDTNMGEVEIIDYETLNNDYIIDPVSYKVTPKEWYISKRLLLTNLFY